MIERMLSFRAYDLNESKGILPFSDHLVGGCIKRKRTDNKGVKYQAKEGR